MSLRKRMFRSIMIFSLCALSGLAAAAVLAAAVFRGQFSREFESLENARLNTGVVDAAGIMEKDYHGDWEQLARDLQALNYNYDLLVTRDGRVVYGDHQEEGEELLRNFPLEEHQSGKTEVYYLQRMTILGKYDETTGSYLLAINGKEEDWWLTPLRQTASTIFYMAVTVIYLGTLLLILQAGHFARRLVRKITEPLEELERGARRIREGNLSEPVVYQGDEEFEQLCQTFNDMQQSVLDAQVQKKKDEQARTDMITGISHDLRTPLTSIQGYVKGVLDGVADTEEKRRAYLSTAYESTKEMNALLQKLFDFSRIESGQLPFHMIRGNLTELIAAWVAEKENLPEQEHARFSFAREGTLFAEIYMDVDQIRRILENLLENSRKYAGTDPVEVEIHVRTRKTRVILEWKDNGAGVPEEKLGRIFERFYRCDESRSTKGSGVGLYVVDWIVRQHGGRTEAENRDGLLIRMYFPKGGQ